MVELPPGPVGRRQRTTTFAGSRRDAERELTRLQREADSQAIDAGRVTVAEYLARWLEDSARLRLAPQSYEVYASRIAVWCAAIGHHRLTRLSAVHIQAAVRQATDAGLAPATIRRDFAVLHGALEQAVLWQLLARNPADGVTLPRPAPRETHALSPEDAIRLLAAARQDHYGIRIILALGLGLRSGECSALQWRDVDLDAGVIRVCRSLQRNNVYKTPKSGKARVVRVPEFVRIALVEQLATHRAARASFGEEWNPDGLVSPGFAGGPIYTSRRVILRVCAAAGLPACRLHDLRHTYSTLLLAGGADVKSVSESLGHASTTITLQVYHHVTPDARAALAEQMDRILRGG